MENEACSICGKKVEKSNGAGKGLCDSCSSYYRILFDREKQTINFEKEELENVAISIIIALIAKAKPAPLAAYSGEYRSKINLEDATVFAGSVPGKDIIFFVDYSHGRAVKAGMKKTQTGFILIDREGTVLPAKVCEIIIESANHYLNFLKGGETKFYL